MRTSLYSILCILIRLGAVIMAVSTIVAVPAVWQTADATHLQEGHLGILFAIGGVSLALAALLWIYPGALARIAAGKSSQQIFESPISADDFLRIVLAVVGVWFVIEAMASLAGVVSRLVVMIMHTDDVPARSMLATELWYFLPLLVKVALGIWLTLGARGLVGWLRSMRERGLPTAAGADESPS
jgi:hypothetical protein